MGAPAASTGQLLAQTLLLAPLFLASRADAGAAAHTFAATWPLLGLLIALAVAANLAASALQRVADGVAYSQISYVIALTGVAAGALLFGERLGVLFWPALALVFAGVVLANRRAAPRAARPPAFAVATTALGGQR